MSRPSSRYRRLTPRKGRGRNPNTPYRFEKWLLPEQPIVHQARVILWNPPRVLLLEHGERIVALSTEIIELAKSRERLGDEHQWMNDAFWDADPQEKAEIRREMNEPGVTDGELRKSIVSKGAELRELTHTAPTEH